MESTNIETKSRAQSLWELLRFALIALAVVIPVRILVAQPFIVSGSSMVPTFANKNYLIINELSYRLGDPERFDVVVFRYPGDTSKFFIKRVIGLPNETVDIKGNVVTITNNEHPDGIILDQPYVKNAGNDLPKRYVMKDSEYFVMGDNRSGSSDSRAWGPVPRNLMIGKPLVRLFPLSQIDMLPGDYKKPLEK
ncbi:MAG: signal peptidase I [Candidatus Pacebacteria bacterium]|nr:signal peptidase I [Candidatus Paceibacterota bacterium]